MSRIRIINPRRVGPKTLAVQQSVLNQSSHVECVLCFYLNHFSMTCSRWVSLSPSGVAKACPLSLNLDHESSECNGIAGRDISGAHFALRSCAQSNKPCIRMQLRRAQSWAHILIDQKESIERTCTSSVGQCSISGSFQDLC